MAKTYNKWVDEIMMDSKLNGTDNDNAKSYLTKIGEKISYVVNQPEELESLKILNNISELFALRFEQLDKKINDHFRKIETLISGKENSEVLKVIEHDKPPIYKGWQTINGNWMYFDWSTGIPVRETWKKSADCWFYLGKDGIILKDIEFSDGKYIYKLDENGKLIEKRENV